MTMRTFEAGQRSDEWAPSHFDPAEYEVVGYFDAYVGPGFTGGSSKSASYPAWYTSEYARQAAVEAFGGDWDGACAHCGHPYIRWVGVVEHLPSGAVLFFGAICVEKAGLPDKAALELRALQKRAEAASAELKRMAYTAERLAVFAVENEDVIEFLFGLADDEGFDFLREMVSNLCYWGDLSERQAQAVRKIRGRRAKDAEKAPEPVPTSPVVTGKRQVEGTVVYTDVRDSAWGMSYKMVVREDDGNRIWSTIPKSLMTAVRNDDGVSELEALRDLRVRFTALVDRSEKDEHFGFARRPSGAVLAGGVD